MNTEFLIVGGIFSAIIGLFVGLICWCNMDKRNPVVRILTGILISSAIGYAMVGAIYLDHRADEKAWNNGYCTICGNEIKFTNASRTPRGTVYYYWYCENCGHTLELTSNFGKGN